jgi:phosphoglycerate dehydrogenase-like enzyme
MNIALLQASLSLTEVNQLIREFPQFLFLSYSEASFQTITEEHWSLVEILLSSHLSTVELAMAPQLRWIHCPTPSLQRLCYEEIETQGNILVTNTREENLQQMGEFVMSGVLAFAKNLFHWRDINQTPPLVWDSKWRHSMWTLPEKVFLQVGLGKPGTEIARQAQQAGMKVWGVDAEASFHPYCSKTFAFADLTDILPLADVISICLPRESEYNKWLRTEQFEAMKDDAILIVLGSSRLVDEAALAEAAKGGKFRGVIIDGQYQIPISPNSPLWNIPNLLITPEVAPRPKIPSTQSLRIFRYNLRQYVHGNYSDMKNLVNPAIALSSSAEIWT